MVKCRRFFCLGLTASVFAPLVQASTLVATVNAGPAWYNAGETQTINLQPEFPNTYDATRATHALASGEFVLSLQRPLTASSLAQLGLALSMDSAARVQGDVWELADPVFNNFNYQYKVTHKQVAVKGKLLSTAFSETILPYLSASVGVGFNKSYHFTMTPKIYAAIPVPAFQANTQTSLAYTLGVGVQRSINQHWQAGVGYEFANWGKSQLARAPGQILSTSGLQLQHFYTHELQLSVSYLV